MKWQRFDYGRRLDDFAAGGCAVHPFELTVDEVIVGPYSASFIDASPLPSSDAWGRALGLDRRPVAPHLLLNLGLSTSVHDVSQQAIAHLAYVSVDFPKPLPLGGTVRGATRFISAKPASKGDKGVVHVQTVLVDESGERVLDFERKALVRGGTLPERPATGSAADESALGVLPTTPFAVAATAWNPPADLFRPALFGAFEDFEPGAIFCHANGRTVGESEHMQLSAVCRNSHPLHWDAAYAKEHSFTGERVVYGGLVLAWTLTQASIDLGGHTVWESRWSDGAHPAPVLAGDTIFSATQIIAVRDTGPHTGEVEMRVVGVKNTRPEALLSAGADLFAAERSKPREERISDKVVEITRKAIVLKRSR